MEGEASFVDTGHVAPGRVTIFATWDTTDPAPPFATLFRSTRGATPSLSEKSNTFLVVAGNAGTRFTSEELIRGLGREDKPEETIWDLSNRSLPVVRERLRALKRHAKTP